MIINELRFLINLRKPKAVLFKLYFYIEKNDIKNLDKTFGNFVRILLEGSNVELTEINSNSHFIHYY